jgi:DNA-directed RNA polymerase subunit M/transcription elongation factor TFIIS
MVKAEAGGKAAFPKRLRFTKTPNSDLSLGRQPLKRIQPCPECGSKRLYKDGKRKISNGEKVQRWLCRDCGYRFSESSVKVDVTGKVRKSFDSGKNH